MALTQIDDRGLKTPIDLLDNEKIRLGIGNDLEIYHDGHSRIKNNTGALTILADDINVSNNANNEQLATFTVNSSCELFFDHSKKFETTANGVTVSGANGAIKTVGSGEVSINIGSTNAGGAAIYFDGDSNGDWVGSDYSWIRHTTGGDMEVCADNPSGDGHIYLKVANGNENAVVAYANAAVELYYDNSKKFETTSGGVSITGTTTFSDSLLLGDDVRFKAGASADLSIYHNSSNNVSYIQQEVAAQHIIIKNTSASATGSIWIEPRSGETAAKFDGTTGEVSLRYGGNEKFKTTSAGVTVTGSQNSAVELRIENTNNSQNAAIAKLSIHGGDAANQGPIIELDRNGAYHQIEEDASGNLDFNDNGTVKFIMESGGNFQVCDGDLVIGTAGHGIDFSANSSGNGTMTSELLDGYEEGTWTPTYGGTTTFGSTNYSAQTGHYTRVGRLITLNFYVDWTSHSGSSGGAAIGGLPYTGLSGHQGAGSIMWTAINIDSNRPHIVAHTSSNNSILYMYASGDDNGWDTMPIDSAGAILGTVSYPI